MADLHRFQPTYRVTSAGVIIYFMDKYTVQITHRSSAVICTRYFNRERNFYRRHWKPFCEKLYRLNYIESIWDVMDVAQKFEISMHSPYSKPYEIKPGTLKRPTIYVYRRRKK